MNRRIDSASSALAGFLLAHRKAILLCQGLLLAAAILLCSTISYDSTVRRSSQSLPSLSIVDAPSHEALVSVSLEVEGDPFSTASREKLSTLVQALGDGEAWWTIVSPDMEARSEPTGIFLSPDRACWTVFLDIKPEARASAWYPFLRALRKAQAGLHISGEPYLTNYIEAKLRWELPFLLCLASLILFAVFWIIFRSFGRALRLWLSSMLPALMTAAFFPALGRPMTMFGIVAPVCALAVSSTYGIHSLRGLDENGGDYRGLLAIKGPIIFLDYLTTFLGFATLLFTPILELRLLGLSSMFGATMSLLIGFLFFPLTDPRIYGGGGKREDGDGRALARQDSLPEKEWQGSRFMATPIALAIVIVVFIMGWNGLSIRASALSAIGKASDVTRDADFFSSHYGALDEVVLHIDSGKGNGLVDMDLFGAIDSYRDFLSADPKVGRVVCYTDAVRAVLRGLPGGSDEPTGPEEIGEALELLSSSSWGSYADLIIDHGWRRASVRVMLRPGYEGVSLISAMKTWTKEAQAMGLTGSLSWSGMPVGTAANNMLMARSQLASLIGYFVVIFLVLLLMTSSLWKSLVIIFPPLAAIFASIGFAGLVGWPLDSGSALGLSIIAGIGIDDALVLVLSPKRTRLTIASIVETTLVLISTLAALVFSGFTLVLQLYVLSALGLCLSTLSVLFLIPALESIRKRKDAP